MIRLAPIALALAFATPPPAARAAEASAWAKGAQSEARLLDGGRAPGGAGLSAGVEIRLAPRFITYWRDPGDAGVPPTFSFAGSANLRSATVRYPAPRRLDEAGAVAFGYQDAVVFPIAVEPADPAQPVVLRVALDYATCRDICLPAHADLLLTLDGAPSTDAAVVAGALAAVPRPSAVGAAGAPSIASVSPDGDGGFTVTARGAGDDPALFVEAPEGWAYEAGPPRRDGDLAVFPVKRVDHPSGVDRSPSAPVVLTLTGTTGAVEASARLDAGPAKP